MARPAAVKADDFGKLDKATQADYAAEPDKEGYHRFLLEPVNGLSLGEVTKTLQALSAEREILAKKEKLLATFVDDEGLPLEPAKARNALAKYAEMASWKPDEKVKEQILAMSAKKDEEWGAKLKAAATTISDLEKGLDESVVEAGLNGAIARHGANPKLARVLKDLIKRDRDEAAGKYVARIMDEGGIPKLSEKTGKAIEWDEYFDGLKKDPEYQIFFPGTGATGTGGLSPGRLPAGGGAGGQFRMQNKYAKEHPGEYAKMGDEARKVGKVVELHD